MSNNITCPSGLVGRIRGMKAREERILADRKLARSGAQLEQILAACWEETLDAGPYDFGEQPIARDGRGPRAVGRRDDARHPAAEGPRRGVNRTTRTAVAPQPANMMTADGRRDRAARATKRWARAANRRTCVCQCSYSIGARAAVGTGVVGSIVNQCAWS